MEQTIEERFGLCKHCLCNTDRYCHTDCHIYSKYCGAVEQKQIDEEQSAKELLHAVDKTAERTRKEVIDKADKWLRAHLPRVIENYPRSNNKTTIMLNEDMRAEFREDMEK